MRAILDSYGKLNAYTTKLPTGVIKVMVISIISGNKATGYGNTWSKALENAIIHYKKQYGQPGKLAILTEETRC